MRALSILLILIFMQMGCSGLLVYEIISSSQFIVDEQHESVPVVNVKYYYDKPDKSKLYPEPKKRSKNHDR